MSTGDQGIRGQGIGASQGCLGCLVLRPGGLAAAQAALGAEEAATQIAALVLDSAEKGARLGDSMVDLDTRHVPMFERCARITEGFCALGAKPCGACRACLAAGEIRRRGPELRREIDTELACYRLEMLAEAAAASLCAEHAPLGPALVAEAKRREARARS